jgi:ABC-2 type transport system permease protein
LTKVLRKFLSILKKDLLLLIRDWPGLAILFIMPAVLLIIITFAQENVMPSKKSVFEVIIVNADSSVLGDNIVNDLANSEYLSLIRVSTPGDARIAIMDGVSQFALIIPDSTTEKLFHLLKSLPESKEHEEGLLSDDLAGITFLYDPGLPRLTKDAVIRPLKTFIQLSAVKVLMIRYTEEVNRSLTKQSSDLAASFSNKDFFNKIPDFPYRSEVIKRFREELDVITKGGSKVEVPVNPSFDSDIIKIDEMIAGSNKSEFRPNAMQNNIPAFTLFAMFFIVIPLAGSIINEKNHGTYNRLRMLPVTYLEIIASKIMVFLIVCILQFIFLMFVGVYIMPGMGEISVINLNVNFLALFIALITSSLAAIGFGIIVGTFASTHSQAATFGSVMVVILALLGGIFVPADLLPDLLKKISIISPLRWGSDAFIGIFARGEGIGSIWKEICLLTGFFGISLVLSVRTFKKQ